MSLDIKQQLIELLQSAGVSGEVELSSPPKPEMGDFAFPCFDLAKQSGKKPNELAQEIKKDLEFRISDLEFVERIETAGPYVNFYLNNRELSGRVLKSIDKDCGQLSKNGKKVVIEFAQPNTHKAFHIGHLRGTVTGESLSRIKEAAGYDVVRVNYQGDVGMHIAKAMWALASQKSKVKNLKSKPIEDRIKFLGEMYAKGATAFEEDENIKAEIVEINDKIYSGDSDIEDLYKETRGWSLEYFDGIYKKLGTRFDKLYFESQVFEDGVEIVKEFLSEDVFKESQGAIIFEGSKHGLHDRVFINSKGFPTYEAKELALHKIRFADFNLDESIIVVAKEQSEYFKVVFKVLESTLPESVGKEKHLSYGWVSLKDGKMSSRTGQVVLAEDLIDRVKEKVISIMKDSTVGDKDNVAGSVSIGALKYSFLKTGVHNDIVFDMEESVTLSGDSGPYLMYIVARINSILKKVGDGNFISKLLGGGESIPAEVSDVEKQLLMKLAEFNGIIEKSSELNDPSKIAHYLFSVAQLFNNFYHEVNILKSEKVEKHFRVRIIKATHAVMTRGLYLLGIATVEEM